MHVAPEDLTPGVLDGSAEHAFSYGACAALALAIHDATGWPLVKITDTSSLEIEGTIGNSGLHWAVQRPDGKLVDVDGAHTPADLVEMFDGDADDGKAAMVICSRLDALDEYVDAKGEPIPVELAASFVEPVLERMRADDAARA